MAYKDTVPATKDIKDRVKEIQTLLKEQRGFPTVSQIHVMEIMTKEYLEGLKKA